MSKSQKTQEAAVDLHQIALALTYRQTLEYFIESNGAKRHLVPFADERIYPDTGDSPDTMYESTRCALHYHDLIETYDAMGKNQSYRVKSWIPILFELTDWYANFNIVYTDDGENRSNLVKRIEDNSSLFRELGDEAQVVDHSTAKKLSWIRKDQSHEDEERTKLVQIVEDNRNNHKKTVWQVSEDAIRLLELQEQVNEQYSPHQ